MPYMISAFADEAATDIEGQIKACLDNGVKWIEVRGVGGRNVSELTLTEARELRKRLEAAGIGVSAIGSPYGKIGITEPFDAHLDSFKRTVEAAGVLGAKLMRVFSFYIPKGEPPADYKAAVLERLRRMLDYGGDVVLCHENEKGIYGDIPERCLELYTAFGGRLRLVFDPANFVQCGVNVQDAIQTLKNAVEYIHVKDCDRATGTVVVAGQGDGCVRQVIDEFYISEKSTFLSIEPHLKVFEGFDRLGDSRSISQGTYGTAGEAFGAAVSALRELLAEALNERVNDKGGYTEWSR